MTAPRGSQVVLLFLLVALIALPSLPTRELMPTDEPRFALVARQMVEDPAPLVPHLGYDPVTRKGEVYADKPPMFFWLISLFSLFTGGVNEISARLPSFVAALAAVLLTWRIGQLLIDGTTGLLAASILATTSQFFLRSSWCSIDMTLTALVLAATYCWLRAARTGESGVSTRVGEDVPVDDGGREPAPRVSSDPRAEAGSRQAAILSGLGGLFAAAATLSKGPVGLIYPLLFLAGDRIASGMPTHSRRSVPEASPLKSSADGCASRLPQGREAAPVRADDRPPLEPRADVAGEHERPSPRSLLRSLLSPSVLAGVLAFLFPVGTWILAIYFVGGSTYTIEILFKQNVTRYVAAWNNIAPWYYYFYRLPVGLLPWTLLLPGAVIAARGLPDRTARPVRGLLLASTALFIFFSISTGKRGVYILPLYPALAILIAVAWQRRDSRAQRTIAAIHVAVLLVAGLLAPFLLPRLAARQLEGIGPVLWLPVLVIMGSSVLAAILHYRGRPGSGLAAQVCGVAALVFTGSILLVPVANRNAGVRDFGAQLAAIVPSDDFLVVDQEGYEQILFYSRLKGARVDFSETRVDATDGRIVLIRRSRHNVVFARGARVVFVIKKERADRVRTALGPSARTLMAGKLYGKPYFVIASR